MATKSPAAVPRGFFDTSLNYWYFDGDKTNRKLKPQYKMENKLQTIGLLGGGSFATVLAKVLTNNNHGVEWYLRNKNIIRGLKKNGFNATYVPQVKFDKNLINPTDNLLGVVQTCNIIVIASPSAYVQEMLKPTNQDHWKNKVIISAIKGVLPKSKLLLNDHMEKYFGFPQEMYVSLMGPAHAEELAEELLTFFTFSGLDKEVTRGAAQLFANNYINTTCNHDVWGTQYAAVLKNIYAIGAGIMQGLGYGVNAISALLSNCYDEARFFLEMHFDKVHPSKRKPTFMGSAYLGDFNVTCYSHHSRNRTLGTFIGQGYTPGRAVSKMEMKAEGYDGARGMYAIFKEIEAEMPFAKGIYRILWKRADPGATIATLLQTVK